MTGADPAEGRQPRPMLGPDGKHYWDGESWVPRPLSECEWDGFTWKTKPTGIESEWDGQRWIAKPVGVESVWDGDDWVVKPAGTEARWDGERWVAKPAGTQARWNGFDWQVRPEGRVHWNGMEWRPGRSPTANLGIGGAVIAVLAVIVLVAVTLVNQRAENQREQDRVQAAASAAASASAAAAQASREQRERDAAAQAKARAEAPALLASMQGEYNLYYSADDGDEPNPQRFIGAQTYFLRANGSTGTFAQFGYDTTGWRMMLCSTGTIVDATPDTVQLAGTEYFRIPGVPPSQLPVRLGLRKLADGPTEQRPFTPAGGHLRVTTTSHHGNGLQYALGGFKQVGYGAPELLSQDVADASMADCANVMKDDQ